MSRGLRNNNPGNIRLSKTQWQGERIPSTDGSFKQFVSMAWGYRAMIKLLQNYKTLYGCGTLRAMIARWAPPSENDTDAYLRTVCRETGIDADAEINVQDRWVMCKIAAAMSLVENGVKADMNDVLVGWGLL